MSQPRAATMLAYTLLTLWALACLSVSFAQTAPAGSGSAVAAPGPSANTKSSGLGAYLGLRVDSIDFRTQASPGTDKISDQDERRLRDFLPLKVGEVLTRQKLRNSMQSLHATGRFANIEIEAAHATDNRVAITFLTRPTFFIGSISVQGEPRPPTASQLANATKLELGQLFTPESFDRAIERMKRVMEDNGYYKSAIKADYDLDANTQQANVTFVVNAGQQALVGKITVNGDPGFSAALVENVAKMHPGDKVAPARVTRALQRLRKRYQKQKRLEAQVFVTERQYRAESNTVDYTFNIQRGPTVDIHLEGARLRKGLVKRYVPIYEENAVDDDLLNEGRRNLRDYFQTEGFFDAAVDFTKRSDEAPEQHLSVVYDIDKGERHKFTTLIIEGNKYFDTETIRERMQIAPASLLLYYGRFSQAMLARDVEAIENLYKTNGFQQVKVSSSVQDDYNNKLGNIEVTVHIDEGPQMLVQSLWVEGNNFFSAEKIRDLVSTTEGQPYSDYNLASDRESVVSFYFNRGFPDVKLETLAEPDPKHPNRVNVKFQITEGEQQFVNRVLLTGLSHTRPYIIQRELDVKPNSPLSQVDMLDTQRRLYDIGIFNEVNVAVQNPQGSSNEKNVIVQVDEAKRYTFNYGLGLEVQTGDTGSNCLNTVSSGTQSTTCQPQGRVGVSPRVSFDLTRINFLGRDHTILLKSRIGRLQQRALVSYEAPRWFNSEDKTLTFTTFFDKTQDVRTFTAERLEGSTQVRDVVNRGTTLLYRLTYRRVRVDPTTLQVSPDQIPLLSKPVRVGFPSITFIRDTRDDPIQSTRGTYSIADLSVASSIFGSESSFSKLLLQNSTYYPFKKKRWVFARSTQIGVEEPFGSATQSFVPLPERFFAGGGNSQRGFSINQAGPRDLQTGFPLGGNALFVNNLELRTPPIALPFVEENLSAVIFHDFGNVFLSASDIFRNMFRISQRNSSSCRDVTNANAGCDFNYMSHAVGGGLRYKTPIGPVRVDIGYNLNPPTFPVRTSSPPHVETLKHFNLFFSIGQTF